MNIENLILIVFFLVVILIVKKFLKTSIKTKKWPYKKKDYLLSIAEKEFYRVLSAIAKKNSYLVFAKVRFEDLLWLPKHTNDRFELRNRVKSRHVDFVLCDKNNIKPLLVIELDDSTHTNKHRQERDNFINDVLHDAGLPIFHQKVQNSYNLQETESEILKLL